MVRAFIGISVSGEVRKHAVDTIEKLKSYPINAKFVEKENLHISLTFLGEINDRQVEEIKFMMNETTKRLKEFKISIGKIMLIPNEKFVRVIAIDVSSPELELLRKEIVENVGGKSHPAHLTLARIKNVENKEKFSEIKNLFIETISQDVKEIKLFRSELSSTGPSYTILHTSELSD